MRVYEVIDDIFLSSQSALNSCCYTMIHWAYLVAFWCSVEWKTNIWINLENELRLMKSSWDFKKILEKNVLSLRHHSTIKFVYLTKEIKIMWRTSTWILSGIWTRTMTFSLLTSLEHQQKNENTKAEVIVMHPT